MKNQTKFLIAIASCFCLYANSSQAQSMNDITGKNWQQKSTYSEIAGSPFLSKQWAPGTVKFVNSTVASAPVELKFDQIEDVILFKNDKGETLELTDPISEFTIAYTAKNGTTEQKLFRAGFAPANGNTAKSYYEIIADGKVKFVKRTLKTIMEESGYNSAAITKTIVEKPSYYVVKDNTPTLVDKNEKGILSAIGDKNAELTAFIKQNKLSLKNDSDIVKLFAYYNSL